MNAGDGGAKCMILKELFCLFGNIGGRVRCFAAVMLFMPPGTSLRRHGIEQTGIKVHGFSTTLFAMFVRFSLVSADLR